MSGARKPYLIQANSPGSRVRGTLEPGSGTVSEKHSEDVASEGNGNLFFYSLAGWLVRTKFKICHSSNDPVVAPARPAMLLPKYRPRGLPESSTHKLETTPAFNDWDNQIFDHLD